MSRFIRMIGCSTTGVGTGVCWKRFTPLVTASAANMRSVSGPHEVGHMPVGGVVVAPSLADPLVQVVGQEPLSGPDPGSLGAVQAGSVSTPVAALGLRVLPPPVAGDEEHGSREPLRSPRILRCQSARAPGRT